MNLRQQITPLPAGLWRSLLAALLSVPTCLFAQSTVTLILVDLQQQGKLAAVNRDVSVGQQGGQRFLKIEKRLRPGQVPGKDERVCGSIASNRSKKCVLISLLSQPSYLILYGARH